MKQTRLRGLAILTLVAYLGSGMSLGLRFTFAGDTDPAAINQCPDGSTALPGFPCLEPDTQFDAVRWYDTLWSASSQGLKNIPDNFGKDTHSTYSRLKSIFSSGVKIGNVAIVRGTPEALSILKDQGEQMGLHYVDTIRMLPDHVVQAAKDVVHGGERVADHATNNWEQTAKFDTQAAQGIAELQQKTIDRMSRLGNWTARSLKDVANQSVNGVIDAGADAVSQLGRTANWTGDCLEDRYRDTKTWMKSLATGTRDTEAQLARWTGRQIPEGYHDTLDWTKESARVTKALTKEVSEYTGSMTAEAFREVVPSVENSAEQSGRMVKSSASFAKDAVVDVNHAVLEDGVRETTHLTFEQIPGAVRSDVAREGRNAKWLWKKGYQDGLKGNLVYAADNYFAGDIEGVVVGTLYALSGVSQGVGYVLVLEPLAFTGNVGIGLTKTVALTAAGTAGTAAVAGLGVGADAAAAAVGSGTVGVAAVAGAGYTVGTALFKASEVALAAGLTAVAVPDVAVVGGAVTAGAAAAGAVRTVGGVAVGSVAMSGVAAGAALGEATIPVLETSLSAITLGGGTVLSAGELALAGVRMGTDIGWGAVKMVGVTSIGTGGELLLPAMDGAITAVRGSEIVGVTAFNNLVKTPTMASFDLVTALTLGGWRFVRDPILGTFHLVAGASGFSYHLVGMAAAQTTNVAFGALYSVAHVPVSLIFHGGLWSLSLGAKSLDLLVAPLRFDVQNRWKQERLPQLEKMLQSQDREVQEEIGTQVNYIRVIFAGKNRGHVNFFTTEKDGKIFKFQRTVRNDCRVIYTSGDTSHALDSFWYDKGCVLDQKKAGN